MKVKACEAVKKSKKLLNFTLDDGTGTDRTILSGIHAYYEPEDLVGKTLLAITNLPPRKMMGIPSCGMLISAIHEEEARSASTPIQLDASISPAQRYHARGYGFTNLRNQLIEALPERHCFQPQVRIKKINAALFQGTLLALAGFRCRCHSIGVALAVNSHWGRSQTTTQRLLHTWLA